MHLGLFIPMVGAPFLTLQETSRMTTFSNAALSPPLKSSFQVHHFDVLSAHLQPNCRRSVASAKGRALGFSESDVLSAHLQSNRRHSVASAKGRAFSFSESGPVLGHANAQSYPTVGTAADHRTNCYQFCHKSICEFFYHSKQLYYQEY